MKLIEVDPTESQPLQAALAGAAEMNRMTIRYPPARPRTQQAALGGEDEHCGIRVKRFGNQLLANLGTIGIRGVYEVHSAFHDPAQQFDGRAATLRRAQIPGPVIRIAPKPRRLTMRSPANVTDPSALAGEGTRLVTVFSSLAAESEE